VNFETEFFRRNFEQIKVEKLQSNFEEKLKNSNFFGKFLRKISTPTSFSEFFKNFEGPEGGSKKIHALHIAPVFRFPPGE
jgi:hypothetical protein